MEDLRDRLQELFKGRMDGRLELLLRDEHFTEIVGTIASRYAPDAVNVILQAMLAVLMRPNLARKTYCADWMVYAISPYDDDDDEKLKYLNEMRSILDQPEIDGMLMWLNAAKDMEFGSLCIDEISKAISFWSKKI